MSEQQVGTMCGPATVKQPKLVKHGLYLERTRTCEAPGCGKTFTTRHAFVARFCGNRCRVQFGQWSFRAAHASNKRVFGVSGEHAR